MDQPKHCNQNELKTNIQNDAQQLGYLKLLFARGLGPVYQRKILENQNAAALLFENRLDRLSCKILPEPLLQSLRSEQTARRAERELVWLSRHHAKIISCFDDDYPPLLTPLSHAPTLLFWRGSPIEWNALTPIAFVGTRYATPYGRQVTDSLIAQLAPFNVVIVSGFAKGIDTAAHTAALKYGLKTVAVLGTGLDLIYPKENEALHDALLSHGGFLSEYPAGSLPHRGHFPDRNRIISGISKAVVVIEAPIQSGSLLTAHLALDQGREVLAVPGNIFSKQSAGCHQLIDQGAKLTSHADDILSAVAGYSAENKIQPKQQATPKEATPKIQRAVREKIAPEIAQNSPLPELGPEEKQVAEMLGSKPKQIEELCLQMDFNPAALTGILTTLMLKGVIEERPGKYFVRV